MKTTSLSLLAGAVLALCVPATATANLVSNGSFEMGVYSNVPTGNGIDASTNSQQLFGGTINGLRDWAVIGGTSEDIAWIGKNHVYGQLAASDGNNFLDLTGWQQGGAFGKGVAQTFFTTLGQHYTLSFDLGNSTDYNSGVSELRVQVGSTSRVVTSVTNNSRNSWDRFSFEFVAQDWGTTLSFTGVQANNYIGLDNVSVTAVPEPETYALLLAGLGVMGAVARRRKSQQA